MIAPTSAWSHSGVRLPSASKVFWLRSDPLTKKGWMRWSLILPSWAGLGDCSVMNVRGQSDGQKWFLGTSVPPPRWALPSLSPFGCPCWAQRCQQCEGRAPPWPPLCPPAPHWLQQQWSRFALICRTKIPGCAGLCGDWGRCVFSLVSLSLGVGGSLFFQLWDRRVPFHLTLAVIASVQFMQQWIAGIY